MAGRSVGSIEITVDADTGQLTAQLIRGGKKAGEAGRKAIEGELRGINAELRKLDTSEAAKQAQAAIRLLRKRIEAQLRGIDLGIDTRKAMADLRTFEAFAEARELALNVKLSERDIAEMNAQLRALSAEQRAATIQFEADLEQANLNVQKFLAERREMKIQVEADLDTVNRNLQQFLAEQNEAEIQFEADLAAINIEVERFINTRRTAEIQFEADLDQINRNVARMVAEQHTIRLLTDLDEREFRRKIARLTSERHEAQIRAVLDLARAEAALVAFERNRDPLQIPIEGDFSDINSRLLAFRRSQENRSLDIDVGAKVARAAREVQLLLTRFDGRTINFETEADLARARASIAAFRTLQSNKEIKIPVDVDLDALESALSVAAARMESGMGAAGQRAGSSFSGGAGQGLSTRMQAIIGGIVLLMEPAVVAVQGLGAAVTSVASSAFSALAGAAGALAPVLAAAGASAATLVVGFQGMGDALGAVTEEFASAASEGRAFNIQADDIQEAMRGLAPAARDVVTAFAELSPQFTAIRNAVQQRLFEGVADSMRELSDDAIPAVGAGLASLAGSFNSFFQELLGRVEEIDFGRIFADLKPVVDAMLDAFLNLFDVIEPFLRAAAPAAQALANSFSKATESLSGMVKAGEQSGKLEEFLTLGVESLKQWGGLAKAAGGALLTLFEAGRASGDRFVTGLTRIIEKFDTWMQSVEGQEALAEFFASGERVMKAMVPVLEGLKDAFKNIVTPEAIGRFEELATAVGEVLPVLASLFEIVGDMRILNTLATLLEVVAQALEPILPVVEELATAFGQGLSRVVIALIPSFAAMARAIGKIAEAITPLLPDLTELAVVMIEAFTPIIVENIDNFATAIEASIPLIRLLTQLLTLWMEVMTPIANVMADVGEVVGVVFEAIGTGVEFAVGKIRDFVNMILDIPLVGRALRAVGIDTDGLSTDMVELEGSFHGVRAGATELTPAVEDTGHAMLDADDAARLAATGFLLVALEALKAAAVARENERGWRMVESSIIGVVDPLDQANKAFERMRDAAEEADEAADHLQDTLALLFDPAAKAASSARDYQEALDGLTEAMQGGSEAQSERESAAEKQIELDRLLAQNADSLSESEKERIPILQEEIAASLALAASLTEQGKAMDITTEAGREASAAAQELVDTVFAQADAMIAQGESQAAAAVAMVGWREEAIATAVAAGATREQAEALLATYNLTPDAIATTFIQSGMTDAQKQAQQYDGDLNGIPDSIDTLINQPGISQAMKDALLYDEDLDGIPDVVDTEIKVEDKATPVIEPVAESLEDLHGRIYESDIITNDAASPVIDEATGKVIGYEQLEGVARLGVLDEATPVIDEATGKVIGYERLRVSATLTATDATQPVLDPLTATLETYAGNTYEADIALKDAAGPVITPVTNALDIYDARIYESEITLLDHTEPVMDPVLGALDVYDQRIYEADIALNDKTGPVLDPVKGALDEYDARIYEADIIADATGATSSTREAQGVVDTFDQTTSSADITVTGADTSKTGVEDVGTALDDVNGKSAETNVSLVNNFIVILQLGAIMLGLKEVSDFHAKPKVTLPDYAKVVSQLAALGTMMFSLDRMTADPRITLPTWFTAISQVGALSSAIRNIPDGSANITVTGVEGAISRVNALDAAIDRLQSKTITVTTRNVTTGGNMTGAIVPGSATGELIRSPTMRLVGERGYDEAIIPLQLPLNRIDPSVRDLAALLRGEGLKGLKPGPTKIINQYMTVNTVVQDPVAVATQVINRSAMLAHN